MTSSTHQPPQNIESFMEDVVRRNPGEVEFHQAVHEVATSVFPHIGDKSVYRDKRILQRMVEPDRTITFRVCWEDDQGNVQVNRGYRVQNNNAIGPYKGGLRFHSSVNLSILKFLAFEQTFKNSLTGLPMGGGKGGADFERRGKSDNEVMRFCQSFMTELYRHIGEDVDIPAGDIGVGSREIGYLFGTYKRLTGRFTGVLTGKGMEYGGSAVRKEATGYGTVFMMENMLGHVGDGIEGKTCLVSGAGNVATYAIEKLNHLGGKVVTLSDSTGFIYDDDGIDANRLAYIKELKAENRGDLELYAREFGAQYHRGAAPWDVPCDLAFPCATQNEISQKQIGTLIRNDCRAISEGANMPTAQKGVRDFIDAKRLFAPGKAANAGGVAVSGLEMTQNSERIKWKEETLHEELRSIMRGIHESCVEYGQETDSNFVDYVQGANIAGFVKVADAMVAQGLV
jgi:glutamate dehydrogenase (NADP+)